MDQYQWLGLDVGARRTGIARSRHGQFAELYGVLEGDLTEQLAGLRQLIDQWQPTVIVVGVPAREDPSHPAEIFRAALAEQLASTAIRLVALPETLTTKEAERRLHEVGKSFRDSDALAAQLILQEYLDHHSQSSSWSKKQV